MNIDYDYQIDKYTEEDIANTHNRIIYIIEQILENNMLLKDIEIATSDEKKRLLYDFNNTKIDYPKDKTIVQLFEEQVEKTPDNIAVVFEDTRLTYKELNEKANSFSNYLKSMGIKKGNIIPVILNRSADLIIAIHAIIKVGAVYLPISPETPKRRIDYILRNTQSSFIITNNYENESIKSINIDGFDFSAYSNKNLNTKMTPYDLLYIIYTSGSTGNPKGVKVCHKNLINFVYNFNKLYNGISNQDRLLASTNISFDVSIFELFMPILNGASLYLYDEPNMTDIYKYCQALVDNKITFAYIPPNILEPVYNVISTYKNISLNKILLGVEPINNTTVSKYFSLNKNMKVINAYGPTETTICATAILVDNNILENYSIIPIGKPFGNLKIFILDKYQKTVPIGIPGEIYISGDNVSNGYLNNSKLTESSFVSIPSLNCNIAYKTGDIAKWDSNGIITFIGRNDSQIKFNGHRIELGEIEKCVYLYSNVEKVVVILKNNKIICYFSSANKININDLKKSLQKNLPSYFIPHFFVQVDTFKLTSNGKINKKELPEIKELSSKKEIILPRNDIDNRLVSLLEKLLNINNISINDSFFDLGGDSLSAINLCINIKNEFNADIFVKDIMQYPIIQDLSDIITKNINNSKKELIKKIPIADSYPISSAQKRIYLTSQNSGFSILYNISGGILLNGEIDIDLLENCIKTLIDRHESLRTYFEISDNKIVQKIKKIVEFKLNITRGADVNYLDNIFKHFVKPFDLGIAPLFRVEFVQFQDNTSALLLDMHHIISDGVSINIFVDELCKLYNGETLPKLNITYKDFAVFENEEISSNTLVDSENYWLSQFKDEVPVLNMPTNHIRPGVQSFEGKKIYSQIDTTLTKQIEELSNKLNITPYMLLISVYYVLLSKYTSQDDIVVGSPIVGRNIPDINNIIGMFVNTLALREKIETNKTFKEFLLQVKEDLLNSYKYQTYPFDQLVGKLNIKRDTSRNPLFDTMFIYQNNGFQNLNFGDVKAEYYIPDTYISKFDLSLEIIPLNETLQLSYEYCTALFDENFIENLSNHYSNILKKVIENVDIKISEIDMLSDEERNRILYEFNNTKTDYPKDKTIAQLFEEQVEKTPNNIAIVFEDKRLTYSEVNKLANNLAHYLKNNGLRNNSIVSIFLDKSLEAIISIIAILKCNCLYMPIDIDYPRKRIDYMLNNSDSKMILTSNNLKDRLENFSNILCIDLSIDIIYNNNNSNNLNSATTPDDLAYIMYTSGSTGNPKGVMVSNKNVIRLVKNNRFIKFENNERILQTGSFVFDACTFEIWGALLNGFELYIIKKQDLLDHIILEKYLKDNKITILWITSPLFNKLSECNPQIFNTPRILLTGGDVLSYKNIESVRNACPNLTIINGYGPTENTTFSTCFTIDKNYKTSIPIGFPISNSTCYIVSKDLTLLPIGVTGELLVGGDGVSKGYLNNESQTKSNFISNVFDSKVLYKTGDLAKWNENGSIEFLGRIDNQIKIRGFRVELNEINIKIQEYSGIKECITITRTINNGKIICSYFSANTKIDISSLKEFLGISLPDYYIPTYLLQLDSLPINTNGKIDKNQLPIPTELDNTSKEKYVQPQTNLQEELVSIWEKILNVSPIGINDNFFQLGGDSLLAMHLNLELLELSNKISYADIFRYPTIYQLSEKINSDSNELLFKKIENLSDNYVSILDNSKKRKMIQHWHPRNILLTGATGFLGIHILDAFIKNETGNIYCIVREKQDLPSKKRLLKKLNYYFGDKYNNLIDKRIFIINGNVSKPNFGLNQKELLDLANSIDLIINSAAVVSHFGNYEDFYNANVKSVKYIVDFCNNFNKKLYHISTRSVAGSKLDSSYLTYKRKNNIKFDESYLYIGQILDNVYSRTKFEAEDIILNAISNGLDGYILRMGNLMPRYSDGVFQENILDNNFINIVASFMKLGFIPNYLLNYMLEFTPVDCAAKAICNLIANSTNTNRIFHIYNHKKISTKRFLKTYKNLGYNIDILSNDEFKKNIKSILQDSISKSKLKYLIDHFDESFNLDYINETTVKSNFTIRYLRRTFFRWPRISKRYLFKFINLLRKVI